MKITRRGFLGVLGLVVVRRPTVIHETINLEIQAIDAESFRQFATDPKQLHGLAYATEELLADSQISFAEIIQQGLRDYTF